METKHWWQSKTIWAGVIAVLIAIYNTTKEQISPGLPEIPEWVFAALGSIGIYGRVTAKATIGATQPPTTPPAVPIILAALLLASSASAQEGIPITDVAARAHVTANAGAMVLTTGDDWSGASIGGTLLYNLHPKLSVFGGYDHGFPVNEVDDSKDFWRAVASVRVHPNAFVGFGYGWFGDDLDGAITQLLVFKPVMKRLDISGTYAHVFADDTVRDFDYVRVFLNYHLIGKE